MFGFLSPQEEKLKGQLDARKGLAAGDVTQDLPEAAQSTGGFAPSSSVDVGGGMTDSQMGGALSGAAQVSQATGGSGAVTGALQGAGTGMAVGGPYGAAIGAGVGLAAGMFGDKAKREAERRQRIINAMKVEMEGKREAAKMLQTGTQSGINSILAGSARALS